MYFSVKRTMKIAGRKYIPCVCYPLPKVLVSTIDKLVEDGKARKYEEAVRFQSGKKIEKSVDDTVNKAIDVSADNDKTTEEANLASTETATKTVKRRKKTSKVNTSEPEETYGEVDATEKEVGEDF